MAGPARPYNERDTMQALNGAPIFLGVLVSTGTAVNNLTTATPFNQVGLGPTASVASPANFSNTLAGKMLLLQPTANGQILPSASNIVTIAQQSVVPVLSGTQAGVLIGSGERVELLMTSTMGWLQWLPQSGSGNCFVWELV